MMSGRSCWGMWVEECLQQRRLARSCSAADDAVLLVADEADNVARTCFGRLSQGLEDGGA